ncbi:IS982 family transposase [Dyadobacter frigoris]|uniref:IS982 family transposase n=1 Tax=Dyadobacter frigoris TaxID=2576211 RepID=A0A4U6D541_9BACT|nr:IS982 family transposase [Dyadobacter frigoris]TKT92459.1 IS982 family transposase [Dyadobacter frigoris]GLU55244.1 transposase [Dyadobacter frigoris]
MFSKDKVTEIFCTVDDFCKEFELRIKELKQVQVNGEKRYRNRPLSMSDSEILTILICFHLGSHKTFKHYYQQIIQDHWIDLFPKSLSYNRFVEVQSRYFVVLAMFLKEKGLGKCTGISFMDSTTAAAAALKVCRNQRIHNHKVFKNLAERGKSSMGWFYGRFAARFKLHLVCNEKGELLSFYLTKGNVDDRNPKHIKKLTEQLFGKIYADKGYLSKALWEMLFADGMQLITKVRKNMKGHIMELKDRLLLRKRAIIETINDELKNLCQIEHTRHRSVNNFIMNILGALVAYCFFPKKPSLNIEEIKTNQLCLAAA